MKLILAIMSQEDEGLTIEALNEYGYLVTKLATSGGFLKRNNTTLLIGTQEPLVEQALDIIRKYAGKRLEKRYYPDSAYAGPHCSGAAFTFPVQTGVGGCTIFVFDTTEIGKELLPKYLNSSGSSDMPTII